MTISVNIDWKQVKRLAIKKLASGRKRKVESVDQSFAESLKRQIKETLESESQKLHRDSLDRRYRLEVSDRLIDIATAYWLKLIAVDGIVDRVSARQIGTEMEIPPSTIRYALHRLNLKFKKNPGRTSSPNRMSAAERQRRYRQRKKARLQQQILAEA